VNNLFIFGTPEFRKDLIEAIYPTLKNFSLDDLINLGKDTISGNVLILFYFFRKNQVINVETIRTLSSLNALKFVQDSYILELLPSLEHIKLKLNESVSKNNPTEEIEKAALICEFLLDNGVIERDDSSIRNLRILYKYSSSELKSREEIEIVPERQPP